MSMKLSALSVAAATEGSSDRELAEGLHRIADPVNAFVPNGGDRLVVTIRE
jgi:hypothetical protein